MAKVGKGKAKKADAQQSLLRIMANAWENDESGIAIFSADGAVLYQNPAFDQLAGHTRLRIIDQEIRGLPNGGAGKEISQFMRECIDREDVGDRRFTIRDNAGRLREIDTRVSRLRDKSGVVTHYVLRSRDFTREALLEKQLRQNQKMEVIGALVSGIAHDFNNILATVITCAEIALDDTPEASAVREDLEHVLKAGRRGKSLIRQILTFSRTREQKLEPLQMAPIIKEGLKLLRASLPANIEIRQAIESEQDLVLADSTQIYQVLMNLCTNAAHAMHAKGGILEVSLAAVDVDPKTADGSPDLHTGPYVRMSVRDTGQGMSRKVLERIFDSFFTTKEHSTGTGLGLPVVQGIVKSHKGAILVESEPGKGTSFHIFLPRVEPGMDCSVDAPPPKAPRGNERILLVDDEKELVYAGAKMLRRLGYKVVASPESLEALELFRAQPDLFDLVITDQSMPKMTGVELAREILSIRPGVPVILCTGFGPDSGEGITLMQAKAIGIREVHRKPLERHEMAEAIRRVLNEGKSG